MQEEAGDRTQMIYKIVRTMQGKPTELAAEENTGVLPGDTVKVEVPPYKRRGTTSSQQLDPERGKTGLASARSDDGKPAPQ